jgi:hypothetical protein
LWPKLVSILLRSLGITSPVWSSWSVFTSTILPWTCLSTKRKEISHSVNYQGQLTLLYGWNPGPAFKLSTT